MILVSYIDILYYNKAVAKLYFHRNSMLQDFLGHMKGENKDQICHYLTVQSITHFILKIRNDKKMSA